MQAERDHLRTIVFPALEERLRARRHDLEWVDLRIGVATASLSEVELRERQVLKVCLAEVSRCRPFLIVLLGDRYGWVPPEDRLRDAAREAGIDGDLSGRSVTDVEIAYGVFDVPDEEVRCYFYFRDPLPYDVMPDEATGAYSDCSGPTPEAADRWKRLTALKQGIEARFPGRVRRYRAAWDATSGKLLIPGNWGQQVLEDVWSDLEAETATGEALGDITWQQAERDALADFVADRTRGYVGRKTLLDGLVGFAMSDMQPFEWGVCLTGAPGSGKSAVFGAFVGRLRKTGVLVLAHAATASPRSTSIELMLRRWIEELAVDIGARTELRNDAAPDAIEREFRTLLVRAAARTRVVLLVDGLDAFEATTQGRHVTWLPAALPANVRFFATAIPGDASGALGRRPGVRTTGLAALDVGEARAIAEAISARYHRTLEPEVLNALLQKQSTEGPAWGNALWLVLALEELHLVDGDDLARARHYDGGPAEQIRALMLDLVAAMPGAIPDLYRASFDRAERLFDPFLTRAFIGLLVIGRAGWRESDFRALLPQLSGESWDELRFASMRRIFRGQLRQRGSAGQWTYAHDQMHVAGTGYLAARGIEETTLHAAAAAHLRQLSRDDPMRLSETMVHLLGAKDWHGAALYYGDPEGTEQEVLGAASVLAKGLIDGRQPVAEARLDELRRMLAAPGDATDAAKLTAILCERLLFELNGKIASRSQLWIGERLARMLHGILGQLIVSHPPEPLLEYNLGIAEERIGDALRAKGDLDGAMPHYRAKRRISRRLSKADPANALWQRDLSVAYHKTGELLRAQGKLSAALRMHRVDLAIAKRLQQRSPDSLDWQRDMAVSEEHIGDALWAKGKLPEALATYRASREITERLVEAQPGNSERLSDLAASHDRIGNVLAQQGNLQAGLEAYRAGLAVRQALTTADPDNAGLQHELSVSYGKIGDLLSYAGDLTAALDAYRTGHAIRERLVGSDPGNALWRREFAVAQSMIGDVLAARGEASEALAAYRAAHDTIKALADAAPGNAEWQRDLAVSLNRIGDHLRLQGRFNAALTVYRTALAVSERLIGIDPSNAARQRDISVAQEKIGDTLRAQGKLVEALAVYEASLAIAARLVETDPSNTEWRRDLSISYNKIGNVHRAAGAHDKALEAYRMDHAMTEALAQANPANAVWQHDLSVSLSSIGNLQVETGDPEEALLAYRGALQIAERLASVEPDNTAWQRNLALSHTQIGTVLASQGDANGLAAYCAALLITERLTALAPENAQWQHDLALSLMRFGLLAAQEADTVAARGAFDRGRLIIRHLLELDAGNSELLDDLAWFEERISELAAS